MPKPQRAREKNVIADLESKLTRIKFLVFEIVMLICACPLG
jgi:hypothetical protein